MVWPQERALTLDLDIKMKNKILYLIYILALVAKTTHAQRNILYNPDEIQRHHAVKVNLLSPFLLSLSISHEFRLDPKNHLQQTFAGSYFSSSDDLNKSEYVNAFFYTLDYRKYNRKKSQEWAGWYKGAFARVGYLQHKYYLLDSNNKVTNYYEKILGLSLGITAGKQKIYQNKFLVDFSLGIYTTIPIIRKHTPTMVDPLPDEAFAFYNTSLAAGIGLRPTLKLGYLF